MEMSKAEYHKAYKLANPEKSKEATDRFLAKATDVMCGCGGRYKSYASKKHFATPKHQRYEAGRVALGVDPEPQQEITSVMEVGTQPVVVVEPIAMARPVPKPRVRKVAVSMDEPVVIAAPVAAPVAMERPVPKPRMRPATASAPMPMRKPTITIKPVPKKRGRKSNVLTLDPVTPAKAPVAPPRAKKAEPATAMAAAEPKPRVKKMKQTLMTDYFPPAPKPEPAPVPKAKTKQAKMTDFFASKKAEKETMAEAPAKKARGRPRKT